MQLRKIASTTTDDIYTKENEFIKNEEQLSRVNYEGENRELRYAVCNAARAIFATIDSFPGSFKDVGSRDNLFKILWVAIKRTTKEAFDQAINKMIEDEMIPHPDRQNFGFVSKLLYLTKHYYDNDRAQICGLDSMMDPIPSWTSMQGIREGSYRSHLAFHELNSPGSWFGFRLPDRIRETFFKWCEVLKDEIKYLDEAKKMSPAYGARYIHTKIRELQNSREYKGIRKMFAVSIREALRLKKELNGKPTTPSREPSTAGGTN